MSSCEFCKGNADSCINVPITVKDATSVNGTKDLSPIPYGSETRHTMFLQYQAQFPSESEEQIRQRVDDFLKKYQVGKYTEPDSRCHDCGVKVGGYHHPGCDDEECPNCHMQLISCGCLVRDDDDEDPDYVVTDEDGPQPKPTKSHK
jgi:hypothetical protein